MLAQPAIPTDCSPSHARWLLLAGVTTAVVMIALLVELIHQNIERGDHLRAEQRAHRQALARHDPRPSAALSPQLQDQADRAHFAAR